MFPTKSQFIWVSEEKIKMWKVNGRQTTGRQVIAKAHFALAFEFSITTTWQKCTFLQIYKEK